MNNASSPTLLEQFLRDECTPYVRKLICDAVRSRESGRARQHFEFNRFSLVVDFENGTAALEDDLDVTPAGTASFALEELLGSLDC